MHEAAKIQIFTCNKEKHEVCCCGSEELPPDFEPLPTNFNKTALLEAHALDRWGWLTKAWNAATTWVANAAKKVVEVVVDAWNTFMDAAKAAIFAGKVIGQCSHKAVLDPALVTKAGADVGPYAGAGTKCINGAGERALKKTRDSFKPKMIEINSCLDGIDRMNNRKAGAMSISVTVSGNMILGGGGEIGLAGDITEEAGEPERSLFFIGMCAGVKTDQSAGVGLSFGFWRNIEDIPGESWGIGLGFDVPTIPPTENGAGVEVIWNRPQGEFIGIVMSVEVGIGLSPIDVSAFFCFTLYTKFYFQEELRIDTEDDELRIDTEDRQDCRECDWKENSWNGCCTDSKPCTVGEGDCDVDSHCAGNLVCKHDNCRSFDSRWSHWSMDCCAQPDWCAKVYEHGSYGGWEEVIYEGRKNLVHRNDAISSVKVNTGCSVSFYHHTNYVGYMVTYSAGTTFVGYNNNDRASSVICQC